MKREDDFQIFIISRFLVSLIYVVLSEFLIWFAASRIVLLFEGEFAVLIYSICVAIMIIPLIVTCKMFSKALMEEVQRMEEQKEAMHQAFEKKRNLMLSDIAHDLRTPITTIAGYSKALNDEMVVTEEKKKEYLQAIENKSERMNELINLLFEYVRLDSDNFSLKRENVEITEFLREIAADLYADLEDKEMDFLVEIPEEPLKVSLDRVQFSRVITNLISNAMKHNPPGTQVRLEMKKKKTGIEISISDNGTLIPEFLAEHIFEPFAMGDASRKSQNGSGLGLSIAKKIVDMHGWELELVQDKVALNKKFLINIHI